MQLQGALLVYTIIMGVVFLAGVVAANIWGNLFLRQTLAVKFAIALPWFASMLIWILILLHARSN